MKTTTTVRTLKKTTTSGSSSGFDTSTHSGIRHGPSIQTRVISGGQSGLRHSLRGSGKVWKKTVLGKKFEISEKLKEKKNYIMYHSGMGHEKNIIEEIEQIAQPKPKEKIIEERQIIDNYDYHEIKNIKKKKDPKRMSITHHQRLSSPFERTILKKYGSSTTVPQEKSYTTTTIKKSNYGAGNNSVNKYSSFTEKQEKNKTVAPSKLYETYKPTKNTTSYTQTKTTKTITTESKAPVKTSIDKYQSRTITTQNKIETNKDGDKKGNAPKYQPKYIPKYRHETEPNRGGDIKTETTQDGDYLIKITTTRKPVEGGKPYGGRRPEDKPRGGSVPRGGQRPKGFGDEPRGSDIVRSSSKPRPGFGGPHGPGERPGFRGPQGPHGPGERPGFGGPHGPHEPGERPRFGGPHGPHGPGERPGFGGPHGPHEPGERPRFGGPHGPHGPGEKPRFGGPHGPHGPGEKPRFGGPHGPHGPGDRPGFRGPHGLHGPGDRPGHQGPHGSGFGGPHLPLGRPASEDRFENKEDKTRLSGKTKSFERPGSFKGPKPGQRPELGGPHSPHGPGSLAYSTEKPRFGPHGPGFGGPRPGFGPHGPGFGGPRPEFGPHGPGFGGPRPEFGPHGPGFGGPRPEFGPHGPGFGGPRPGFRPHGPGFGGPRPGFGNEELEFGFEEPEFGEHRPEFGEPRPGFGGPRPGFGGPSPGFGGPRPGFGTHGVFHHKPGCPLYEAELEAQRRRAESQQTITRSFEQKTFSSSSHRPFIAQKIGRSSSQPRGDIRSSEKRTVTLHTEKKSSNRGGPTQIKLQQTLHTSEGGDNYNYYESKNILKKGRRLPITIHHRRGEFGAYTDDIPERKHHNRSSSYTKSKTSSKLSTNLNNTFTKVNVLKSVSVNKPRGGSATKINTNKYKPKTTYKKIQTTTKTTSGTSGISKSSAKKSGASSYSEYKKYEQKEKKRNGSTNSSKYQFKQNTDYKRGGAGTGSESSYKYTRTDEYRQGGPSYTNYDEQYQYTTQTDEYRYGGNTGGFSSQYQYFDDNEFEIIDCPVHGRQTIRRNRYYNNYY